jgi:hypothetical protein
LIAHLAARRMVSRCTGQNRRSSFLRKCCFTIEGLNRNDGLGHNILNRRGADTLAKLGDEQPIGIRVGKTDELTDSLCLEKVAWLRTV